MSSAYSQVETIGTVDKHQADTVLRVMVNDTIGVDGGGAGCAVQVRIDGVNDRGSNSGTEDTGTEAVVGSFSSAIFPATIVTEFRGVPPGPHTLTLWMRATYLKADTSLCLEGGGVYPVAVPHTALVDEMN